MSRLPVLLLVAAAALAGCATPVPPVSAPGAAAPGSPAGAPTWWTVRVRMGYSDAAHVQWHLDALLAEQVFAPLIARYGQAFTLWRFHRRAAQDEKGHQLRFLFRADPAVKARVVAAVRSSAVLDALLRAGLVTAVLLPETPDGAAVEATSDPGWPQAIQRSWPWFAMGVSANWLALVKEESARLGPAPRDDLDALVQHYGEVDQAVDALWREYAQHAWLHHLNALFGYKPLVLREQRLTRF